LRSVSFPPYNRSELDSKSVASGSHSAFLSFFAPFAKVLNFRCCLLAAQPKSKKDLFMPSSLGRSLREDLLSRGYSRRNFGRIISVMAGGVALPFYNESALAQRSASGVLTPMPADAVRIGGNENPVGPCPAAIEAAAKIIPHLNRYQPTNEIAEFKETVAGLEGLSPQNVIPWAGSSDPLHRATLAFTSPAHSLVMGDPGYEAAGRTADFVGTKVVRVPLRKDFSHDVRAMVAADPNAGMYYICNPNNPSGTITSREDIEWLLNNKPKGSVLLLDEAYIHFSNAEKGSPWVAAGKDLIILRTFSKAYGMAGMRLGMTLGRPDLLEKIMPYGASATDFVPITALVAGTASLKVSTLMPERKKLVADVREQTFDFLEKHKFSYIPSQTNFFMLEVNRPGREVMQAMTKENVYIGRTWSAWPTKVRVTVGSSTDMRQFQSALLKVMA
jgi:histidinol-phosphate aminotransferase